jgi:hypothetical protein
MSTSVTLSTNFIECIKSNAITLIVAIYLIVIAYYMTKDPEKLFTKIYLYTTIAVVPIVIGVIYALNNSGSSEKSQFETGDYIKYGFGLILFLLVVYFLNNINISAQMVYLATGFIQLVILLMIIVALAIIYKVGYNYLYKMQGWSGFIVNLIFYIPCMLLDLLEYVKADLKQAPKAVYILLIIELILGLLYIYAPKITKTFSKSLSNKDGKVVLAEPLTISKESRLSSYVDLQNGVLGDKSIVNNKFAISAWVYITPMHSSHSGDVTIFEFTDYHPRLIYNGEKGKFKVFLNQSKFEEFEMPLQKWNHVVFNYAKSNADIFINGELKGSVKRDEVNEKLTIGDAIVVGQANGLTGGMCNIVYFNRPLFQYEIETIYSLNKEADPPTI